ncbi:hypothetical protein [uncultured Paracoccus sp.]|uniref:hypothetical protein n=1 Tax=uncultured Paracoccus sp. TaxID=189685 RepID=UPI0026271134|nr:hypothetical protein [uncultured Paracoccus sp.]
MATERRPLRRGTVQFCGPTSWPASSPFKLAFTCHIEKSRDRGYLSSLEPRDLERRAGMVLGKIGRTLRREGVSGLWARLRHPKRSGGPAAVTPPQRPPFRLIGQDPVLTGRVAAALQRCLGQGGLTWAGSGAGSGDAATIRIIGPVDPHDIRPGEILLFPDAATALKLVGGTRAPDLALCGAVLLPDAALLKPFRDAGLGEGRLFVLPSLGDPARTGLAGDLLRWLIAAGALDPGTIDPALFPVLETLTPHSRLCLSLPESPDRRASFLSHELREFFIFDGLRLKPGWQGAGWSHATIARAALARNAVPLLVCEDDMTPSADFAARLASVEAYLADADWDMFSGLLTSIPEDCRVHHVETRDGLTFVHLDYATGMVLNIYRSRALERLAAWQPGGGHPETDTVDAWLSRLPGLRAITTIPFLAGHDTAAVSTVFGFANRRYDSLIRASEQRLNRLATEWLKRL